MESLVEKMCFTLNERWEDDCKNVPIICEDFRKRMKRVLDMVRDEIAKETK